MCAVRCGAVGDQSDRWSGLRSVGGVTDLDVVVEEDTVGVVDMVDQYSIAEPAVVGERLDGGVVLRAVTPRGGASPAGASASRSKAPLRGVFVARGRTLGRRHLRPELSATPVFGR
jgi:hypothetical protein